MWMCGRRRQWTQTRAACAILAVASTPAQQGFTSAQRAGIIIREIPRQHRIKQADKRRRKGAPMTDQIRVERRGLKSHSSGESRPARPRSNAGCPTSRCCTHLLDVASGCGRRFFSPTFHVCIVRRRSSAWRRLSTTMRASSRSSLDLHDLGKFSRQFQWKPFLDSGRALLGAATDRALSRV